MTWLPKHLKGSVSKYPSAVNVFNADKTKYSLFHKTSKTDDVLLLLPKLLTNYNKVEKVGSIKSLESY